MASGSDARAITRSRAGLSSSTISRLKIEISTVLSTSEKDLKALKVYPARNEITCIVADYQSVLGNRLRDAVDEALTRDTVHAVI